MSASLGHIAPNFQLQAHEKREADKEEIKGRLRDKGDRAFADVANVHKDGGGGNSGPPIFEDDALDSDEDRKNKKKRRAREPSSSFSAPELISSGARKLYEKTLAVCAVVAGAAIEDPKTKRSIWLGVRTGSSPSNPQGT